MQQQALQLRPTALLAAIFCGTLAALAATGTRAQPAAEAAGLAATAPGRAAALSPPAAASAPRAGPAAPRPAARTGSRISSAPLQPCTSVEVDQPLTLALGKSQLVRLDRPVARMLVGGAEGRAGRAFDTTPHIQRRSAPAAGNGDAEGDAGASGASSPRGGGDAVQSTNIYHLRDGQSLPPPTRSGAGLGMDGVGQMDITLLSPTELFVVGRKTGSMNVILQGNDGRCLVKDVAITVDPNTLQSKLSELMPEESGVKVRGADNALVLTGTVADSMRLDQVLTLAGAYGDGKKVVNMLRVTAPQQVMLEVVIAEVSKNLLDRLGSAVDLTRVTGGGSNTFSLITDFLSGGGGILQALRRGRSAFAIDAQKNDGLVRVLAEPNIMAISGQSASFLSGGKIFIPVAQTPNLEAGFVTVRLEEKEFGVGLKFTPTVLDGRVNLKVTSEVSELSQTGTPFTTIGGVTAVLPSMTTRRVDTTVQLGDGQSFVVAGLIKHNVTEAVNKFPGLGEAPVLGALFRSTEFQNDLTELMFVVTPRLVKPLVAVPTVPTDNHVVPTRNDVMLRGAAEGQPPAAPPERPAP